VKGKGLRMEDLEGIGFGLGRFVPSRFGVRLKVGSFGEFLGREGCRSDFSKI
jgi:hypothetical protein